MGAREPAMIALILLAGCTPDRREVRRSERVAATAARAGYIPPATEVDRTAPQRAADGRAGPGWGAWDDHGESVIR